MKLFEGFKQKSGIHVFDVILDWSKSFLPIIFDVILDWSKSFLPIIFEVEVSYLYFAPTCSL